MDNFVIKPTDKNHLIDLLNRKDSFGIPLHNENDNKFNYEFNNLKLTLKDKYGKKTLYVHGSVLKSCRYFERMFSFYNKSNNLFNAIEFHFSDKDLSCDIIYSLYGFELSEITEWKHKIHIHMIQDFLLLQPISIHDLKIPENEFECLINEVDSFGYTNDIITLIFNNIPISYDLTKIPKNILQTIFDLNKRTYQILNKINNTMIAL
ncbi:hypothetical protein QLL95_gp0041 [Cotonvirus japonicus]|uniref:BTB domain-containing protein n=1 Tax=Cotonvirus japonicus TaxID=2811091 RepID=A0ABM7NQV5_9VIRU|nr:hypothetical protein QLL95_gp0041 [Cotonvirus japonicus]BCS82530.1 hypothetical protein [Cotonvirus japonicus]